MVIWGWFAHTVFDSSGVLVRSNGKREITIRNFSTTEAAVIDYVGNQQQQYFNLLVRDFYLIWASGWISPIKWNIVKLGRWYGAYDGCKLIPKKQ